MKKLILLIIVVALIAVITLVLNKVKTRPGEQGVACTTEALICPDGSGVGRSGPQCEFKACPNMAYFTGMLEKNDSGFRLIMQASLDTNAEVPYAMPVRFSAVSRDVTEFVGKRVVIKGTFVTGNTLEATSIELEPMSPTAS